MTTSSRQKSTELQRQQILATNGQVELRSRFTNTGSASRRVDSARGRTVRPQPLQLLAERAREKAGTYQRDELDEQLGELNRGTITDDDAHTQALQEAAEAESLRDSSANAMAAGFERDRVDTFSKLARYETSLERSLYKALHELQRLQAVRAGRAVLAPVAVDVTVDASQ